MAFGFARSLGATYFGNMAVRRMQTLTKSEDIKKFTQTAFVGSEADNMLRVALDIGEGLLRNGADVHRVEFTIEKICRSYGAVHVEVFSIYSLILSSVRLADGSYSAQTRRVLDISNNMLMIEGYNSLSRTICEKTPSFDEVDRLILEMKNRCRYPGWLSVIGYVLASGSFAIFFGGAVRDGIVAGAIAIILYVLDRINFDYFNRMVKTLMTAFVAGMLSGVAFKLGLADNVNMVLVGTMMLLIPGVALGNATRDLLCGDTIAGSLKVVQSIITAIVIAIGYALSIIVLGG